ncbi:hypothetical protein [Pyrinomonas sp.]|uniref:MGDG synthase family glycosyltransferase n=1 Tax=Pyrinomonas sp. TaxID=2080306 RepID=UPI003319327A
MNRRSEVESTPTAGSFDLLDSRSGPACNPDRSEKGKDSSLVNSWTSGGNRRVLLLTLSFGSGHVRAAQAVAQQISVVAPDARTLVVDALDECRALFRALYVWPYWTMIRRAPALWNGLFAMRRRTQTKLSATAPAVLFEWGCAHVFRTIESFAPDVIVAAEVAACEMAALARRRNLTRARIVAVITDHETEPAWVKDEVDIYAVADERVGEQLSSWGAPPAAIHVTGIPTDMQRGTNIAAARARYGIADDRPVILLMGGGMGPTHMDRVAAALCAAGEPLHLIAVAGRDRRIERALARIEPRSPTTLHRLGWTDDVPALMQLAALLVSKPGGLTLAEAANCALPAVLYDPIPGPEERNARRYAAFGAALLAQDAREAAALALRLARDRRERRRMSARMKLLASPEAARHIAQLALEAVSSARSGGRI